MVWGLLFFADILDISSKLAWLDDVWIQWIGVGFIVITLSMRWMLLRRSGEYVELDDSGIRHVGAGGRSTRLLWTDVVDLRRKRLGGSFVLLGSMGGGAVQINRGLEAFGMLMTDVISQLDQYRMRRLVSHAGLNSVRRPKTYTRSWWWQAGIGVLWLILLMNALQTDLSVFVVAAFGAAAVAKSAFKHPYRVVVDAATLRLRFPLRIRQVAMSEIAECALVPYRDGGRWAFAPAVVPFEGRDAIVLKGREWLRPRNSMIIIIMIRYSMSLDGQLVEIALCLKQAPPL